jgi:hypothetical protein
MAGPNSFHGARAVVKINDQDGKPQTVGVFNSVSYSIGITVIPIEVLGSLLPVELCQTGQDAVQLTCSGFRAIGAGPYANGKAPTVSDLLRYDGVTLQIFDRQNANTVAEITETMFVVENAKCTGWRTTVNAKAVADLELSYMGIVGYDETGTKAMQTDATAVTYPIPTPV